ncbi:hypothetical protein [Streptomyces cellulosae]|uniref:hypothetical protein n=1 Tax=Streptomyces cellulosae TaxID=1968 RepID=UPI0004CC218A|nr:hypothetical protein [Streptomyces cellulosae]
MNTRGHTRTLKFTAVLAMVVLALTGFSTGRHGHRGSSGSGGGGCSSSSQDHDSSSSSNSSSSSGGGSYGSGSDDDSYGGSTADSYGSSSGSSGGSSYRRRPTYRSTPTASGSGKALMDGRARLISCATSTRPYATVEISNPNNREAEFQAWVMFYDAQGSQLLMNSSTVTVPAKGKANTEVKLEKRYLTSVDHCAAELEAEVR